MKIFKVNELFEMSQTYAYAPVSKKRHPIKRMTTYVYVFISEDGTKYFVDLVEVHDEYLTACFADEKNYKRGKNFKWKYTLTNKHDAIKVLNTVIKIIKDFAEWHKVEQFAINTAEDKVRTYKYIFEKYFKGWEIIIKRDGWERYNMHVIKPEIKPA